MYVHISNDKENKKVVVSYEIAQNEYYYENEFCQFFIDSNLPINTIQELCINTNEDLSELINYLKQDGVLVAYNKKQNEVTVIRDTSGLSSVYYYHDKNELIFSSNNNKIAQVKQLPLLKSAIIQWLTFDFLWDGQTLYKDVKQVLMNQKLVFNKEFQIIENVFTPLSLNQKDNTDSEAKNIENLRSEIVKAHQIYLRQKNIVYLSGGIDSVAMLIALDDLVEKNQIENHSFKVKSTQEDETEYAKSIADHLNADIKIIERDITNEVSFELFKSKVNKLNNPYPGIWLFANQITNCKDQIYYAGQDTRLHTPALNIIDKIAFKFFALTSKLSFIATFLNLLFIPSQLFFEFITQFKFFKKRVFVGLKRFSYITNTHKYVLKYYFKQDKNYYKNLGLPELFYNTASKNYSIDLKKIYTERELYNYIVSVKWKEQYVNDIRYMIDMVKDEGGRLAMPFYNISLANFSATIPFKLANKSIIGKSSFSEEKVTVNKFVLREALKNKINDKTYYRAKAVSSTFHIIFNQGLTKLLRLVIANDLKHPQSVIVNLNLQSFIDFFYTKTTPFEIEDGSYLLKIHDLCCVIIYAEEVNYKIV